MYYLGKYKIDLRSLQNRREKLTKGPFFFLLLKLAQINFISADYVCCGKVEFQLANSRLLSFIECGK